MSGAPVRVGVIGTGALGFHHARLYRGVPGATLVGIVDTDPARAAQVSKELGTEAFSDIDALLARVDAVSVVVPETFHALPSVMPAAWFSVTVA